MKKIVFALLAAAATAGAAQAQAQGRSMMAPRAYVGAAAVIYDNNFPIPREATNIDRDEWEASGKIFGGVDLDETWGAEVGWAYFREAEANYTVNGLRQTAKTSTHGVYLAGKGKIALNPQFSLYGKLGVAYTNVDVSSSDPSIRRGDEDDANLYLGVGAEYKFHPQWSAVAEYERYGESKAFGARPDVLTIGAKYIF